MLGGFYINDFNLFGRGWQINIPDDAADRNDVASLWQIYIRNKYGADVSLRSIADALVLPVCEHVLGAAAARPA